MSDLHSTLGNSAGVGSSERLLKSSARAHTMPERLMLWCT